LSTHVTHAEFVQQQHKNISFMVSTVQVTKKHRNLTSHLSIKTSYIYYTNYQTHWTKARWS